MPGPVKFCEKCGAPCDKDEAYCPACFQEVSNEQPVEELQGKPVTDWLAAIDNKADRYIKIFRKNEHKKCFVHANWAATFFNIYWVFYRKMYLYGLVFLLAVSILGTSATAGIAAVLKTDAIALKTQNDQLQVMLNEAYQADEDTRAIYEEKLQVEKQLQRLTILFVLGSVAANLAISFLCASFADCLYRQHLMKRMATLEQCGTSIGMIFAALPLVAIDNAIGDRLLEGIVDIFL